MTLTPLPPLLYIAFLPLPSRTCFCNTLQLLQVSRGIVCIKSKPPASVENPESRQTSPLLMFYPESTLLLQFPCVILFIIARPSLANHLSFPFLLTRLSLV